MDACISSSKNSILAVKDAIPDLTLQLIAVLIFSCIATRVITGLQSRPKRVREGEPHAVRKLPYWIPWIGHSISFFDGDRDFVTRAGRVMNEPVFGLHIAGEIYNIVLAPSLVNSVFSQRGASTDFLVYQIADRLFGDGGMFRSMNPNDHKSLHHSFSFLMRDPSLTDVSSAALKSIERETPNLVSFCRSVVDQASWERHGEVTVIDGSTPACEANLFALMRNFVGYITTSVFMGQAILDFYPDLLQDLWTLDSQSYSLMAGAPRWLPHPGVSAAYAARYRLQKVIATFQAAFGEAEDGRDPGVEFRDLDDISELERVRLRVWKRLGYAPAAKASGDLGFLWAMNINSTNTVFWNVLRIITDRKLLSAVREEIAPFVKVSRISPEESGLPIPEPPQLSIDLDGLFTLCPITKAIMFETFRLHSNSLSYRRLATDLTITESADDAKIAGIRQPRTYRFRKGDTIVMPHGVHQVDSRYFPNPEKFDYSRFITTDSGKGIKRVDMGTIKPFGGGISACKGRHFAEREMLAFTAAILSMWDIEPVSDEGWKIPGMVPSPGSYRPSKDVRVRLRIRV
ncbi:Cytochrome P450 [Elaphomyces granulatus]